MRRRYLTPETARQITIEIANATFAARSAELWGQGSTAVASDSTHVRAYDQNLFTEWHSRYSGRGVLIYWHVEKKSLAIHYQLINCTASEVAAMVEGAMRHGTTMDAAVEHLRGLPADEREHDVLDEDVARSRRSSMPTSTAWAATASPPVRRVRGCGPCGTRRPCTSTRTTASRTDRREPTTAMHFGRHCSQAQHPQLFVIVNV